MSIKIAYCDSHAGDYACTDVVGGPDAAACNVLACTEDAWAFYDPSDTGADEALEMVDGVLVEPCAVCESVMVPWSRMAPCDECLRWDVLAGAVLTAGTV